MIFHHTFVFLKRDNLNQSLFKTIINDFSSCICVNTVLIDQCLNVNLSIKIKSLFRVDP